MSLNCVTGMKANETGCLVKGVTLVTPVTPVLEGAGLCSDSAFPNWPYITLLASRVGNCTPPDHPFALHLPTHLNSTWPVVRIGFDQQTGWP